MADIEKQTMPESESMQRFEQAVDIGLKVAEPLKETNERLAKALIWTNLFWAIVLALFIAFAYLTPSEVEQTQNFPEQTQEQTVKGVS